MKQLLSLILLMVPVLFIALAYSEGGIFAVQLYFMYLISVFMTVLSPIIGLKLLKSK